MKNFAIARLGALLAASAATLPAERPGVIPKRSSPSETVPAEAMQRIHDEVQTPYKYGIVLKGEVDEVVDCPNVFRHGGHWYMVYVANRSKAGYQTHLAVSDDLLHWSKQGTILPFSKQGWDAWQADGGIALYDTRWEGGDHELGRFKGKYWLSYLGGAEHGYEPDPLSIGLATTSDPAKPAEWTRLPANPLLTPLQADARPFERTTLYKSAIIHDEAESLGWPFVMYYNGKSPPDGHEAIGMAVSRDLEHWQRYGEEPVVKNLGASRWAISGDPQISRIGKIWVMFYFGAFWKPGAFDTFACSFDLAHWTKWTGPDLVAPSVSYDRQFAHKPWLLKHDGIVYHFYCAVGDQGRVIALATSRALKAPLILGP